MASEVDIANIALGHLGDNATVASLDPPEGSAQAEHCARFYPIARDALLELHDWKFATRRVTLAELTSHTEAWEYAYAKPADCIRIIGIHDPNVTDDQVEANTKVGQPYTVEINDDLAEVILTDQEDAVAWYVCQMTDTTKFSPLFTMALTHQLASLLAGPVLKGDVGSAEGKRQAQLAKFYLDKAGVSDANQRKVEPTHAVAWMTGR